MFLSCVGQGPSSSGVAALGTPFPQLPVHSFGLGFIVLWRDMFPVGFLFLKFLLPVGGWGIIVHVSFVLGALRISGKVAQLSTSMAFLVGFGGFPGPVLVVAFKFVKVL